MLNKISKVTIAIIVIIMTLYYGAILFGEKKDPVYNFTDLLITYKNCVIIGKTEVNDTPKLYLANPYLKDDKVIDYTVKVTRDVYNNSFIGDTIGKTKFIYQR